MSEAGGPSAQSGIFYQNSIAALYLARLCSQADQEERTQVVAVRVEAPEQVDDIVVTFGSEHREFIQAKEHLPASGDAWYKLWRNLDAQCREPGFRASDQLRIVIGEPTAVQGQLREMTERARGAQNSSEWLASLTGSMQELLTRIRECLVAEFAADESLHKLFAAARVEVIGLESIDQHPWLPDSNRMRAHLLSVLRDKVGGRARNRRAFHAAELLTELQAKDGVSINDGEGGLAAYRDALTRLHENIGLPGAPPAGKIGSLFVWPRLEVLEPQSFPATFDEDEQGSVRGKAIDLREFPEGPIPCAAIVAGAGFGKTSLLAAITHRRARSAWIPALVSLVDFAKFGCSVLEYLQGNVSPRLACNVRWKQHSAAGCSLLLFDGLDEVSSEHRTRVLGAVREFSARFPRVPWLLTTRDAATLSVSLETPIIRLLHLDREATREFCSAFVSDASTARQIVARLVSSPELMRLARVPLFLALILDFHRRDPKRALPTVRSTLLEEYLDRLLDPKNYRPTLVMSARRLLRALSERLALTALDEPSIPIASWCPPPDLSLAGPESIDAALDDLVACGLLRRDGPYVRFALPVVQEYLAGRHLAKDRPEELSVRFEGALTRPWAEALQFALETHADPEPLLREFLAVEDDLFSSRLRAVGRCIANGARVSPSTRTEVGERLAELSASSEHGGLGQRAAQIVAAGFATPLPKQLLLRLENAEGLHNESGSLLAAAGDNELTLRVLRAALEKGRLPLPDDGWRLALSKVGGIALRMLTDFAVRARSQRRTWSAVQHFLSALDDANLEATTLQGELERDPSLPLNVRIAIYRLYKGPLPIDALDVALLVLRQDLYAWGIVDGGVEAMDVLWRMPNAEATWRAAINDERIHLSVRCALIFTVLKQRERDSVLKLLNRLSEMLVILELKHAALLARAAIGDEQAMAIATREVPVMSGDILLTWAAVASNYRDGTIVAGAINLLRDVAHPVSFKARMLAPTLAHAMTYESEVRHLNGGAAVRKIEHPARHLAADLLWEWSQGPANLDDRLDLLTHASSLGHASATDALRQQVDILLEVFASRLIEQSNPIGHSFAAAIEQLESTELRLPLERLGSCAVQPHSRVQSSSIRLIAERGTRAALDLLVATLPQLLPVFRSDALEQAEQLSLKLGVRVASA